MAQLTQEQYQKLIERGLTPERIAQVAEAKGFDLPGETGIKGIGTGIAKSLLETVRTTGAIGQEIAQQTAGRVVETITGTPKEDLGTQIYDEKPEVLEPQGTAEKTGALVGDIATFFIPGAKGTQIAGSIIKKTGEKVFKQGIGVSAKEAPYLQTYKARHPLTERIATLISDKPLKAPTTNADTAIRQGLFGTESLIGIQSKRAADNVWKNVVAPALKRSKKTVSMPQFIKEIEGEVVKVADLSRKRELIRGLDAFKEDYKSIKNVDLEKLQSFKEGWAKFLPDKVYRGKPIGGAFREIQNIATQLARNTIYKDLGPEVRAAYFDYGNLKNLQELGQKAMTKGKLKGGFGSFTSGIIDMVLTPIATTAGLTLYKVGKGIEFVGRAGLKTVGEIFGL